MTDIENAKKEVNRLIEKYNKVIQSGNKYNEEMTKKDFILPFFRALGWDIEDSNEVTAEESLLKGTVDYAFLVNKNYKFFVEAKPLGCDLKKFAKQAIEYGVNSGNTWVVLTNFESLIVFNCEWKEKEWWKNALFEQLNCNDYITRFDKLWILSKEGTTNDALEKYATSISKRVPRTPISKELLTKFLQYRIKLSKEISKTNKYCEEEIDEMVQRLLVRLLFIRNCEDRGYETIHRLSSIIEGFRTHKKGLSKFLKVVFDYYDKNYDSSIFEEMELDKIKFDEALIVEIIEGLYYSSDSLRYDFNIIPADVMGNLYEQYLGHILKKTPQRAKLKEGKAHRKEQGIYYTPTYIVDYIVKNTLGELLKNKKVDASKIRVLDPACGSGSFLVKAFDVLNEHYAKDKMYGQKTLTGYSTKERILKDNIFGVDLDRQAAEIAQLNLLLKIAEKGQKLPLLKQNIRVGNSLIDDEKVAGDKAFKWEEQFKEIIQYDTKGNLKEGNGFDVIIGNPPYGAELNEQETEYLNNNIINDKSRDSANYFIGKSMKLLKEGGILGFIAPKGLSYVPSSENIRSLIIDNQLIKILDVSEAFGKDVQYEQIIIILRKGKVKFKEFGTGYYAVNNFIESGSLIEALTKERLLIWSNKENINIIRKILTNSIKLKEIANSRRGLGCNKFVSLVKNDFVCFKGQNVQRYYLDGINYVSKDKINQDYKWLLKPKIIAQEIVGRYGRPLFGNFRNIRLKAMLDLDNSLTLDTVVNIFDIEAKYDIRFILALLNSRLMSWFFHTYFYNKAQITVHFGNEYVRNVPIPKDISETAQKRVSLLVDKMLSLNKRLNEIGDKKTDARIRIEEEIKKTDAEIDELVYKIYGITEKEKEIIEESLK